MAQTENSSKNERNHYDESYDDTKIALTEMRLQFETLLEMQKEERIELSKIKKEELDGLRESFEKQTKHLKHIIIGLILTLCLILGSIIGGVVYVLSNYEIETTYQNVTVGGDGESNIHDGIHYGD